MAFEEVALLGVLKAEMKALQADVQLVFEMANKTAGLWEIYQAGEQVDKQDYGMAVKKVEHVGWNQDKLTV